MKPSEATDLAELLAGTADGGFAIDAEGRIVLWNRAAESMLGHTEREVVGRRCCDLLMGDDENGNRLCCRGCHIMEIVEDRYPGPQLRHADSHEGRVAHLGERQHAPGLERRSGDRTVHLIRDVTATREILALIRERLATPPRPRPRRRTAHGVLTRREIEILHLIASGLNTKDTAERLHVSPATVRNHVQNILGKLGAHSRLEAVAYATRHRLI